MSETTVDRAGLAAWVAAQPGVKASPVQAPDLAALGGDAGFRQYFRSSAAPGYLVAYAPPETENNDAFVCLADYFRRHGVLAPEVIAYDPERGFLLLEDFGSELFSLGLNENSAGSRYALATETLIDLQRMSGGQLQWRGREYTVPCYGRDLLRREMELLPEWFLERLLGLTLSDDQRGLLDEVFGDLEDSAQEQPQVLVHRDYHSRNLMITDSGRLGVIDFQDAVVGPFTYDPVSLFRDCYVRWSCDEVDRWLLEYRQKAMAAGIIEADISAEQVRQWFDLMGLQRHLKVLGIFARLWLRDGKQRYLSDLPLVLRYVIEVSQSYDKTQKLADFLLREAIPRCQEAPWYRDWRRAGDRV